MVWKQGWGQEGEAAASTLFHWDFFTWKQKLNTFPLVMWLKRSTAVDSVIWILVEDEGKVVSWSGWKSAMLGIPCSDTRWWHQIYNITQPSLSRMTDLTPCEKFIHQQLVRDTEELGINTGQFHWVQGFLISLGLEEEMDLRDRCFQNLEITVSPSWKWGSPPAFTEIQALRQHKGCQFIASF